MSSVEPTAQCYVNAVNAQNLNALVNCFAPNGVVIDVTRHIQGTDAIRTWAQNEVIGGTLRVLENHPHIGGTSLLVHWAPKGSSGWSANYDFMTSNGRITQASLRYA